MSRKAWNRLGDKPLTPYERTKRYKLKKYAEYENLPKIECACGCGNLIAPINKLGKPAKYKHGHNPEGDKTRFTKGQTAWNKGTGKPKPPMELRGSVMKPIGWYEHVVESIRKRDTSGDKNPFYGKHHTDNTKQVLSDKLTGENHPGWKGGASTLPYGVGFTRKFKRLIRERDNNKCQRCGTKKNKSRALEIHHIDFDKTNNDPTNLITVCGKCNIYFNFHQEESLQAFPKRKMLLA